MNAGHLDYSTDEFELDPKCGEWVEPEDRERHQRTVAEKRENAVKKLMQWLPTITKEAGEDCPICYERVHQVKMTTCAHLFCERCLIAALAVDSRCPSCRETDVLKEIKKQKILDEKANQEKFFK